MNYYNPYFYSMPNIATASRTGLFSRLFGGLSFSRIMNGTQRALSFANQAIPFVKQVKPMIGNAKTMFKVMNEFKRTERPIYKSNYSTNNSIIKQGSIENNNFNDIKKENYDNGPTFFM